MRLNAIIFGLTLNLAAGAAMACPSPERCGGDRYGQSTYDRYEDVTRYGPPGYAGGYADERRYAYDGGYDNLDEDARHLSAIPFDAPGTWEDDRGLYIHGHRGEPCGCGAGGLTLSSSFFDDVGGVGPIPHGGYYGEGGYYVVAGGSGASSRAVASASARASASVSVRYRGGWRHHGHKGGGKHR